jgi:23S rRNA (uracil1939-C5)-methyltransferase
MPEVEIASLGGRGDGIGDTDQGRLYVPYTVPGDKVGVRLGPAAGDGRMGELVELLAPGPARVEPPCRHFHDCGGCTLQHVQADFYAAWKRDIVVSALARQGLDTATVAALVRIAPGDRRRADFVARRVGGKVLLGFHRRASNKIVDLDVCLVLDPRLIALAPPLRTLLAGLLQPGAALDVKATVTDGGIDLLLEGGLAPTLRQREMLAAFAIAQGLARLAIRASRTGPVDVIAVLQAALVRFGGVAVELPPGSFLQASPAAEAALVAVVLGATEGAKRIADLYAGCGTFSLPLAASAEVLAVENDPTLAAALQSAANLAQRRLHVERRDLTRRPLAADELRRFDAVVFDPPRIGAKQQAMALADSNVPLVVAVSCAPATFARDAKFLAHGGYRLDHVVPVDQFLWSAHVELVGIFRR